jgi:hypothetical protein
MLSVVETDVGLLNQSTRLALALGVTKFITISIINLATFYLSN